MGLLTKRRSLGQETGVAKMTKLYRGRGAGEGRAQPSLWAGDYRGEGGHASQEDL